MPNNCWNFVVLTGNLQTLQKIKLRFESSESGVFSLKNYQCLLVSDVSDMDEEDFGSRRFSPQVELVDGKLLISGDSDRSPMIGLFETICADWGVEGQLEFEETAEDFAGIIGWNSKGVEIQNQQWTYLERTYMKDPQMFWEEMSYRYQLYDTFEELVEGLQLHKWDTQNVLDLDELNKNMMSRKL